MYSSVLDQQNCQYKSNETGTDGVYVQKFKQTLEIHK